AITTKGSPATTEIAESSTRIDVIALTDPVGDGSGLGTSVGLAIGDVVGDGEGPMLGRGVSSTGRGVASVGSGENVGAPMIVGDGSGDGVPSAFVAGGVSAGVTRGPTLKSLAPGSGENTSRGGAPVA